MRLSLFLTFAVLVLALTPAVRAAEPFTVVIESLDTEIFPGEAATYMLTITNLEAESDSFTISTDDVAWIVDAQGLLADIQPGANRSVALELSGRGELSPGVKLIPIKVRSANTREFRLATAEVRVRNPNAGPGQYAASIFLAASVDERIDPRQPFTLSVRLRNRNARDYPALLVTAASDAVTRSYTTTLGPVTGDDGEKTNQLSLSLDARTAPGTYPLTVTLTADNQTVNSFTTNLVVVSYDTDARTEETLGGWFKTTTTYTVRNDGNTPRTLTVEHPASAFARLFTTSPSDYDVEGSALVFTARLEPNQDASFAVTENYRLLALFILLVVLSVVAYFLFRSPVVVRKEATVKGGADGVSELRVRLHVKNRSARAVEQLHVVDKATSMADVVKESTLGTLQPSKVVRKPGHGTLIRWDIDSLDAFEERIITYRVTAKLRLIGDVYLPAAKVKFDQGGRERTAYSNEVNIGREE